MEQLIPDAISIAVAAWLDNTEDKNASELLKQEAILNKANADCRRDKAENLIQNMAKLRIALIKFECSYEQLKRSHGKCEFIEDKIKEIKRLIKEYSFQKNQL